MKKRQRRESYNFQFEYDGKWYACQRVVTGTRTLTQRIDVTGVGSKDDSATYGHGAHPIATMEGIARIIAGEILGQAASRPAKI